MTTTTLIERLPANWDSADNFGDGWDERGIDPSRIWASLFCEWLRTKYPDAGLTVCGDEIIGPATYVYLDANVQWDTPSRDSLPDLPDSLYSEFSESVGDRWVDAILHWDDTEELLDGIL